MTTDFVEGEQVKIVKGVYKIFRKGVYKRQATNVSVVVFINGKDRTIRSTSIQKMPSTPTSSTSTSTSNPNTVTMSRETYEGLTKEIEMMTARLKALEVKMKRLNN